MPSILNHLWISCYNRGLLTNSGFGRLPRFQSQIPSYRLCDRGHLPFISVSCVPVGGDDKEGVLNYWRVVWGLPEMLSQVC